VERVADEIDGVELGVADFDVFLVGAGIKSAFDRQAGFRRRADQLDDSEAIHQRTTAPVLCDVTEQAMLDLVPFRRPWRIMADVERQSRLVGQRLQLDFPQPNPRPVRTSAIGGDRQLRCVGITLAPHALQPATNRRDRELSGVRRDPEADPSCVGGHVVDAVGSDFAERLAFEVVNTNRLRRD
jgi:hypothetical protein